MKASRTRPAGGNSIEREEFIYTGKSALNVPRAIVRVRGAVENPRAPRAGGTARSREKTGAAGIVLRGAGAESRRATLRVWGVTGLHRRSGDTKFG